MKITKELIRKWLWDGRLDKALASKATKKKHKHQHGEQFKSVNHSGISPAEYRHHHMRMVKGKLIKKALKKKASKKK